jgi:cytochrome P450
MASLAVTIIWRGRPGQPLRSGNPGAVRARPEYGSPMASSAGLGSPPGALPLLGHFPAYARDPLGFVTRIATEYGGVVPFRLGRFPALLLTDPGAIDEVLVAKSRDFRKSRAAGRVGVVVGNGLLLSEGDTWRQHRRLVQPAFQHDRVAAWGETMVRETEAFVSAWDDGEVRDIHGDMAALTLSIVARTLLDSHLEERDVKGVRRSVMILTDHFDSRFNSIAFFIPDWLPTPGNVRMRLAIRRLDAIVYRLIGIRRATDGRGGDAISMLLEASSGAAKPLTDRALRDEVMTLFMAGHETTAVALAWSLYLLGKNPEAAAALQAELVDVLIDRLPTAADLPRLRFTEAVVLEALRLYPPAYALSREAIKPTTVAGRALPTGGIAFISVWATHRRPDIFEAPSMFRPERWLDGLARRLPRGAYLPFAEGPRKCIGASFAMQEAVLVLATIARRFSVKPVAVQEIRLRPAVTLRPAGPISLAVQARAVRSEVESV